MALELAAGALIGTALSELHGAIKDARSKISSFEPILKRLESTLVAITPKLHEIILLNEKLNHYHQSGIADLTILARDGTELVAKCSKLSPFNYVKKAQYSKMLHDLDCRVLRYFDTVLQLDQLKDSKQILLVLNELHCKLFPLDNDDAKSRLIDDEIRSLSNLGAARWGGGGAEELENEQLLDDFFRKEEDRAKYSSSSVVWDNQVDDILKRVPKVRKENRAEYSSSSLVWGNQVYDDILKRVPEVRKEDRAENSSSSRERDDKVDDIIKRLLKVPVMLSEAEILWLCSTARAIFLQQPNLLQLQPPIIICGDIRGQYPDLLKLFECGGFPPRSQYLFLGGYVDRGKQSLETICLLLCYKIKYPKSFFLLRGSRECEHINRNCGFYEECKRRFNVRLWKTFIDCFNCLPVAALINDRILCVHGGISPDLKYLDQISNIPRPSEVPETGLLRDLLFSDPCRYIQGWGMNDRGYSYTFGPDKVSEFLEMKDMDLICRAHQVVKDGYEFFPKRQLVTINSVPYSSAEYDYTGAVMLLVDEFLVCSFKILRCAS